MWEQCFSIIEKQKKTEFDGVPPEEETQKKGRFGILNPWNLVQKMQNVIARRSPEKDQQLNTMIKNESLELIKFYLSNLNMSLGYATEILTIIAQK